MEKSKTRGWTRREVLAAAPVAVAGLYGLAGCGRGGGAAKGASLDKRVQGAHPFDLVVVREGEPKDLVRRAMEAMGGMGRFVSRGDVVLLKPNIGFNRPPELAANSNPDVVREVAILALEAGAGRVVVFDNTLYEPRNCYSRSGIADAVGGLGVTLEFADERKFVDTAIGGEWLKEWPLYRSVMEADKVINIPIAKQHSAAQLSMGMKNLMGVIGGKRDSFHQNIDTALADLSAKLRPTLTVLDAYRILIRNGPQGGSPDDVVLKRTLAVGADPVAVDAFGCTLFDLAPDAVGYVKEAQARGLGKMAPPAERVKTISLPA